jgi:hypothetical protein
MRKKQEGKAHRQKKGATRRSRKNDLPEARASEQEAGVKIATPKSSRKTGSFLIEKVYDN